MDEWVEYLEKENVCLTFTTESPPCDKVFETDDPVWVKVKPAASRKSLQVIQLEYENEQDTQEDIVEVMTRFEEL